MSRIKASIAIVSALIGVLILCGGANAAPSIDSVTNSITSDDSVYPVVEYEQSVTFSVTANEAIVTWTWYINSVAQSNNYDNITTLFAAPFHHNVSVIGTNAGGSTQRITWYPVIQRELAAEHVELLNESGYDRVLTSISGEPDFEAFLSASTLPYTLVLGRLFFLMVYGIFFVMLWIRQESSIIPIVLGFSIGGLLLGFISEDFAPTAVLFIIIGAMGVLYSVYRER